MELTFGAIVVAALAAFVGAAVQGSIGFGMNLVTVPALALVVPSSLPAVVILLAIPISVSMLQHEHHEVDRAGIGWLLGGRLPGSLLGAWIAVSVDATQLQRLVGVTVLLFVVTTTMAPPIPVLRSTQALAGMVSGVTGTAAGIGGPPLALLYQHHPGGPMRSTLAVCYLVGTFLSLGILAVVGAVAGSHILLALALAPLVLLGARLGRRSHTVLDRGWLRPAVLAFAAASAAVVIADSLS